MKYPNRPTKKAVAKFVDRFERFLDWQGWREKNGDFCDWACPAAANFHVGFYGPRPDWVHELCQELAGVPEPLRCGFGDENVQAEVDNIPCPCFYHGCKEKAVSAARKGLRRYRKKTEGK